MDRIPSEILADFLKKPRSVEEVADHFHVTERLVISRLREGLTRGKISLIRSPLRLRETEAGSQLRRIPKELRVSQESELIRKVRILRAGPRNQSLHLTGKGFSRSPKFQSDIATALPTGGIALKLSKPLMRRAKNKLRSNPSSRQALVNLSRERKLLLGPSDLMRILSHVKAHPTTIADTRETLTISGAELKRLIRIGLLKESWGRGGVGVTIRLSQEGLRQLTWMKEASKLDQRAKRALFVSLKQNFLPF